VVAARREADALDHTVDSLGSALADRPAAAAAFTFAPRSARAAVERLEDEAHPFPAQLVRSTIAHGAKVLAAEHDLPEVGRSSPAAQAGKVLLPDPTAPSRGERAAPNPS